MELQIFGRYTTKNNRRVVIRERNTKVTGFIFQSAVFYGNTIFPTDLLISYDDKGKALKVYNQNKNIWLAREFLEDYDIVKNCTYESALRIMEELC
jgi:hypothetical protein